MNLILSNIVRFISLILVQVFLVNQIDLGFMNSYLSVVVYLSFLLTFPTKVSKYLTMIVALVLGITIDMFLNTTNLQQQQAPIQ